MNHWVMAFPCIVYFTSVGTCSSPPLPDVNTLTDITGVVIGILFVYQNSGMWPDTTTFGDFTTLYYSIAVSLNVLLTLMIVIRLIVHIRNIRKATGTSGFSGLHAAATTVVMMLIESYAIYAAALLLFIISWSVDSWASNIFNVVSGTAQVRALSTFLQWVPWTLLFNHGCTQVIAPYLIIIRVAKQRALTSESISGSIGSIRFRSQGSADGDGSLPDEDPTNTLGENSEAPGELATGDENAVEEIPL